MAVTVTKACTKCGEVKPLSEFYKRRASEDGHAFICKECTRIRARMWYVDNPKRAAANHGRYRAGHKEEAAAYKQKWYADNPERARAESREYYTDHKDRIAATRRQYREEHKEEAAATRRQYLGKNPGRAAATRRAWRKANPERHAELLRKHNERKSGLPGTYSEDQWKTLCAFFDHICPRCGKKVEQFTRDHIIPVTQSGSSNYITNMQPLCGSCNSSKCNYHDTDYRSLDVQLWARREMIGYHLVFPPIVHFMARQPMEA